ncbi:hypothetical protein K438DRAFT_1963231 [Mycena galopus ATCC 62051]|nr:hypothetical protein K438DRAFT_1963231 [Mycena galopus ATCC 62051]
MESTASRPKDLKERVLDAIDAKLANSPLDLTVPSIAEHVWVQLESLSAHQVEEFLRNGRHTLSVLYLDFMATRENPLGAYDMISHVLFTQRTYQLVVKHAIHSPFSSSSLPIAKSLVYFWVAALQRSLDPAEFVAWFACVFGPVIETAENTIKAETPGPDDATKEDTTKDVEAEQPPAKRQRTDTEAKYKNALVTFSQLRTVASEAAKVRPLRPRSSSSNVIARAESEVLGRVRQAAASITQTTLAPSSSFAPVLDPKPLRMPGAWPLSPLRTRAACQDSVSQFRHSYVQLAKPQHFCPLQH